MWPSGGFDVEELPNAETRSLGKCGAQWNSMMLPDNSHKKSSNTGPEPQTLKMLAADGHNLNVTSAWSATTPLQPSSKLAYRKSMRNILNAQVTPCLGILQHSQATLLPLSEVATKATPAVREDKKQAIKSDL